MPRIALLALLLLVLTAPPARAQAEPFPGQTWVVPAEGFVWRASSWPAAQPSQMFDFTVYLDSYEELPDALAVEVATVPDLGDDGTLADAGVIERYEARPLGGHADIFAARTRLEAPWLGTPGTYYWQASYADDDELYASPVRALTIAPAPAPDPPQAQASPPQVAVAVPGAAVGARPPLAARTARTIVRRAILAATHRSYRGLTYRCATAPAAATCRPSWRDRRYRYRGTLRIATGLGGISASFTGTRAAHSCARRCARSYSWTATL